MSCLLKPRVKASCPCLREPTLTVHIVGAEVWISNGSENSVTLCAGELFGFGLGGFKEIGSGYLAA